jgi:large repetitive protein
LSFSWYMWRKRFVILWVLTGVITILCHAEAFAHVNRGAFSLIRYLEPNAKDDEATTPEDTPVVVNVLANDEADGEEIDPATVDLNPKTQSIDKIITDSKGEFRVNDAGEVTYIPARDFTGRSSIKYSVNDREGDRSDEATLSLLVTDVNDPPVITGQTPDPVVIDEGTSFTITFNNLVVTDPDSPYPTGFSLHISGGSNYSVSGNTVTPSPGFSGSLSVQVSVSDGESSSNTFDFEIEVSNVNNAPVIVGQNPDPITMNEDQSLTIDLDNLEVNDSDNAYPAGFTLTVLQGANYTVSGNAITPSPNFTGSLSVPVHVTDGQSTSNVFNLAVSVVSSNDVPVITGQTPDPLTTGEDAPITISLNHLVVTDADNLYPQDFTLSVGSGANYSVSGHTVTPASNFEGMLYVPVSVNDGSASSNTFSVEIAVSGSNDTPEITGQVSALSTDEDNGIRILLADLQVSDSDNNYPSDFTLAVLAGPDYTVSGTTVIPASDFTGVLSVSVQVSDGVNLSNIFSVSITVNPVNDAPVISGYQTISTAENQSVEIQFSDLTVVDPDNSYPDGFTISVGTGADYTVSGNIVTPSTGFNGTLSVPVAVSDGSATSNTVTVSIQVAAVNDPPVISGQNPLSVIEDNSITLQLADFSVSDSDNVFPNGFTIRVEPGPDYSVSENTIIPMQDFTGSLTVGVIVNDGTSDSPVFPAVISVTPVNDAPVITGQVPLTTSEDVPITIQLSDLLVSDPDSSFPDSFTLTLSAGDNYFVSGNSITPGPDFRGTLTIPTQVTDGELNSNVYSLILTVEDANDPPVIIGQQPVSTPEDTPVTISFSDLTVLDTDNSYPTGFTLTIVAGTDYTVSGNTITPAADFTGTLNVTVTVNDGISESAPFQFQIQVGDSNDPPVITGQVPLSTNEEQAFALQLSHLTVVDPDNSYPNGFTILVAPGLNYTVDDTSVTPALNFTGTLLVPVRVNDGVNNSPTFDLKIEVLPVNDPPSFDAIANVNVSENAPPGNVHINNISRGPNEEDQILTFSASSSHPDIVPNPAIAYHGSGQTALLSYTVTPNRSGVVTINVVATDSGPNTPPNQNTYSSTFQISISEINNAPTLDAIPAQSIEEDSPLVSIPLSGISSGLSEAQEMTVTATTNRPDLFEVLTVSYSSPSATGALQVKPAANMNGVAQITITVTDNGSNISPSVNFITRSFPLSILPINDPPVFISKPLTVAAVEELYEYNIVIDDEESESLTISADEKPAWATLTSTGSNKAKLAGTPPVAATGTSHVKLVVKDGLFTVAQDFDLVVNSRPTVSTFDVATQEDEVLTFQASQFANAYADVNQHALQAIQITGLPVSGALKVNGVQVQLLDTISVADITSLSYTPDANYFGADGFGWKASDGYHFSKSSAQVNVTIGAVNDPPVITMETDTLAYDINGQPALLTSLFDVFDPDDDSLSSAEIAFENTSFQAEYDQFIFNNPSGLHVAYDLLKGRLSLSGRAPIREYREVVRNIRYNHLNTIDPLLRMKGVRYTVKDENVASESVIRFVDMNFTFVELEIPTGFTPNGDGANDTWIITRPGGVEDFQDALIHVFNSRGFLVHRSIGFGNPWDGKFNGETLPAGTYYFTIDLKLRSKRIYKGVVTILR